MKTTPVKIKTSSREVTIGMLDTKNKTFFKSIQGSKHLFRVLDAWGIDGRYFTDVLLPNNYTIKITDTEDGTIYTTTAKTIDKKGQYYHFKNKDDDKAQIFLSRRHWDIEKPKLLTEEEQAKEDYYKFLS
jgi:hypothetical protein